MIGLIARKDFFLNLTSARFILGFLICLFIIPFTLVVSMDRYKGQENVYKVLNDNAEKLLNEARVYSQARPEVVRKPQSLSVFCEGISENLGMSTKVYLGDYPMFLSGQATAKDNPLLNAFFSIDFTSIIAIIMSLLALVFSYDCFTREKENGTIKMILVNKINRSSFFIGKLLGILLTLLPILFFCYLLGILFLVVSPNVALDSNTWLSIGLLFISAVLYVVVFVLLGMFISSMSRQSSTSIIVSLLVWIWFLFLMPNMASYAAQNFVKTDLYENLQFAVSEVNKRHSKQRRDKRLEIQKQLGIDGPNSFISKNDDDGRIEFYGGPKVTFDFHRILTPFEVSYLLDYADKKWALQKSYVDDLMKQEKTQHYLSLLSPSEIFIQLSSSLCHTDANAHSLYMDKLREYRESMIQYFRSNKYFESSLWFTPNKYDLLCDSEEEYKKLSGDWYEAFLKGKEAEKEFSEKYMPKEWLSENNAYLDLSDFPRFAYKPQITGPALNYAISRFAMLLFIALVILMLTMLRFSGYRI
ncbi:MAG: ABC transporter permease subunit [Prevotellaceae bacterium]|jgi:ABC-type transport system involved in multi-copper enzyme maturation permease subunit|nr:ABC transporter permease subunit [Prevotellaceae bacterium]